MSRRTPMRVERNVFGFLVLFFVVVATVYWVLAREPAGAIALAFSGIVSSMVAGYISAQARTIDPRPEDDKEGEVYQGAGVLGFFAPRSIWPMWCAICIAVMCLGPIFGWWLLFLGAGLGVWAAMGWAYEFYRGDYQH